jgi:hypothetical protein
MSFGYDNNNLDPDLAPAYVDNKTPLDRIGARRLSTVIQQFMHNTLNEYRYDFNDGQTRATLTSEITEYMDDIQNRRGVHDFNVICNETNNTLEDIDNGRLNLDVYIQPTRSVEYINISASVLPPDAITNEKKIEFKSDADAYRHRLGL